MRLLSLARLMLFAALLLSACRNNPSSPTSPLDIPSVYDLTGYTANVATEARVRTELAALTAHMQVGRNMDSTLTLASLRSFWDGTTLQQITPLLYRNKVNVALEELQKATGKRTRYPWESAPTGDGGVVPTTNGGRIGYLYDENMLEMEQVIEKGLFAAAMYNHAVSLINTGNITEATIDRLVEIYGAKPSFANNERSTDPQRDRFTAQYAARRSDINDRNSLYEQIKRNLITAKAAVRAGSAYNSERDKALADFKLNWEKVLAATVINYCHSTLAALTSGVRDDATITSAMHAYGEAVGFLSGWKAVPASQRRITDAQIDELLERLRAPFDATASAQSFRFLSSSPTAAELFRLDGRNDPGVGVIERLAQIYGFTDAEVESFKLNWVAQQNRR